MCVLPHACVPSRRQIKTNTTRPNFGTFCLLVGNQRQGIFKVSTIAPRLYATSRTLAETHRACLLSVERINLPRTVCRKRCFFTRLMLSTAGLYLLNPSRE